MLNDLLATLKRDGVAQTTPAILWPNYDHWRAQVHQEGQRFLALCRENPDSYSHPKKRFWQASHRCPEKPMPPQKALAPLSNMAVHVFPFLQCYNIDYVVVQHRVDIPVYSQHWHRDNEALCVLKVFLFLTDCLTPDDGPFEYVNQSFWPHDADLCPARCYPTIPIHPPQERIRTFLVPQDTIVIANTSGLHRGGVVAPGHHRLQAIWSFAPAVLGTASDKAYG